MVGFFPNTESTRVGTIALPFPNEKLPNNRVGEPAQTMAQKIMILCDISLISSLFISSAYHFPLVELFAQLN